MDDLQSTLSELQQQHDLTVLRLASLLPGPGSAPQLGQKRDSDVSTDALENATPGSLAADLKHYKELFAKLRLAYVEQLTKEKFLRATTSDPPSYISAAQNSTLEAQQRTSKEALKIKKEDAEVQTRQLEERAADLARRHIALTAQKEQVAALPGSIEELGARIANLREDVPPPTKVSANPSLNLPLGQTRSMLAEREEQREPLDARLEKIQAAVQRRTQERETLETDLRRMEEQKRRVVAEAKRAKAEQEGGDGTLAEMARWEAGREEVLRRLGLGLSTGRSM